MFSKTMYFHEMNPQVIEESIWKALLSTQASLLGLTQQNWKLMWNQPQEIFILQNGGRLPANTKTPRSLCTEIVSSRRNKLASDFQARFLESYKCKYEFYSDWAHFKLIFLLAYTAHPETTAMLQLACGPEKKLTIAISCQPLQTADEAHDRDRDWTECPDLVMNYLGSAIFKHHLYVEGTTFSISTGQITEVRGISFEVFAYLCITVSSFENKLHADNIFVTWIGGQFIFAKLLSWLSPEAQAGRNEVPEVGLEQPQHHRRVIALHPADTTEYLKLTKRAEDAHELLYSNRKTWIEAYAAKCQALMF